MKKTLQIMMLVALMLPFASQAQDTLTVHDGTTTSSYVPIYGFYTDAYLRSQTVYPATELTSISGSSIIGMVFYASEENVSWGDAVFDVKITEISTTTLADFDNSTSTSVYTGTLSISNNIMLVTFNTPYAYQGGNLLVEFDNIAEGTYASSSWYGEEVTGASVQGYNYSSFDGISATVRNFIPKTSFLYGSGCLTPSYPNVTDISSNNATIQWGGSADSYNVRYRIGTASWTETTSSTNSIELSGLTASSTYELQVQSVCGENTSDWSTPITFTTLQQMYTISLATNNAEMGSVSLRYADNRVIVGDMVKTFECSSSHQYGVCTDGTNIYTTSWSTSIDDGYMFHVYNTNGDSIDAFNISNVQPIRDITTDGTYFYGGANGDTIYVMDFTSRTLVSTITCTGVQIRHISYDSVRDGFWIGSWSTMALYDRSGNKIQDGPTVNHVSSSAYYYNGKEHLLLFTQPNSDCQLYDYNITDNTLSSEPILDFTATTPNTTGSSGGSFIGMYNGQLCWFGDAQQTPNLIGIYPLGVATSLTVLEGCELVATATPNDGFFFLNWSDNNTDNIRNIVANSNLSLTAIFSDTQGISDVNSNDKNVYSANGRIFVRGAEGMTVSVYDMMGREVIPASTTYETPVLQNGVYLVKIGTLPAQKVVVMQ